MRTQACGLSSLHTVGFESPFRTNLRSREITSASYGWQLNAYLPAFSERTIEPREGCPV